MTDLTINEIFYSIQGESSYAGKPCVFVRLTFCNLRCTYCDTEYAFYEGNKMSVAGIVDRVSTFPCNLVEITGGEPLVQDGVHELMTSLCDNGYEVLIETSGSLDISGVDPRVKRIVDFKCPSSGMESKNFWKNTDYLTKADEVKFVIGSNVDFRWAISKITEHDIEKKCSILMSPVFGEMKPADLARLVMDCGIDIRFQLQMHKYVWEPDLRGV